MTPAAWFALSVLCALVFGINAVNTYVGDLTGPRIVAWVSGLGSLGSMIMAIVAFFRIPRRPSSRS